MGKFLVKLSPAELQACRAALKVINEKTQELGLVKRGHQHLWNDLAEKYSFVGKKIEIDYETGLVMEKEGFHDRESDEVSDG